MPPCTCCFQVEAEEVADVMSQLPSALKDSGRGRELFLSLCDVEIARAWTGVWEPLPHQDRLGNRTRTLALNVAACDASLLICEAPAFAAIESLMEVWMPEGGV